MYLQSADESAENMAHVGSVTLKVIVHNKLNDMLFFIYFDIWISCLIGE
jgi:hypothetical protein